MLLANKRIVITGAARGLGRDFSQAALEAGAEVLMCDVLADVVHDQAESLREQGWPAHALTVDLSIPESIQGIGQWLRANGWDQVDGLINCAAIATGVGGKTLDEYDPELWERVMTVNVTGTWLVTRELFDFLKQPAPKSTQPMDHSDASQEPHLPSSSVINVASDTALWGAPRLMAYVASKGAVLAMTRAMAREMGEHNIRVNAISPGLTLVEATEYVPQERHELYVTGRALQRPQYPSDVNGTAIYLLSDLASFVSGQNIPVNGGFVFN